MAPLRLHKEFLHCLLFSFEIPMHHTRGSLPK
jgi:hypothetical protein